MYLLVLFAFLHPNEPKEHVVLKPFVHYDDCAIEASRRNKPDPLRPMQSGDVWVCAKVLGGV